jgi:hypothetical protein
MRFQLLNPPPHDACSIPLGSVVLPLGIPGGPAQWGPNKSLYLGLDSVATAWGLFHNLDSVPVRSSLQAFWEKRRRVSVLLPHHGTALNLRGNFSMKVWASQIEAASACSYGAGQRTGINYQLHMGRYNGPV